eukprot:scaffold16820_cov102-Isochrysis_galbana.AAC.1
MASSHSGHSMLRCASLKLGESPACAAMTGHGAIPPKGASVGECLVGRHASGRAVKRGRAGLG